MPEINSNALVYLVQLVDERLQLLKNEVSHRETGDSDLLELEEELMACSEVAMELERCYHQAVNVTGNMPAYKELVKR